MVFTGKEYQQIPLFTANPKHMKKEMIAALFLQFEEAAYDYKGIECWSARDLQDVFHYSEWRNFVKVIDKAKTSCQSAGEAISNHFVDTNKMVTLGSQSEREIEDIALTCYAYTAME